MRDKSIVVEGVSKRYLIGRHPVPGDGLRHALETALRAPFVRPRSRLRSGPAEAEFWALRDISFEICRGEILGIIGRNGAGKSTLLKLLSRITEPTTGRIRIRGRIASLLEVGTGFHPELTGRENVFLNGAILGMGRREIRRVFDQIVSFAGIEQFVDTPVKRFSSGMYVRLAFAVAAHLEADILVIDEVLAVGDAEFQRKCLQRMDEIAHTNGRTVLFVSHNMAAIENLCSRCLLLDKGLVRATGEPNEIIRLYLETATSSTFAHRNLVGDVERSGNGSVRLTRFHLEDSRGNLVRCATSGMDVVFVFGYEVTGSSLPQRIDAGFSIASASEQLYFVLYSTYTGQSLRVVDRKGEFRCVVRKLPLAAGQYVLGARLVADQDEADWPRGGVGVLEVEPGDFWGTGSAGFGSGAPLLIDGEWAVVSDVRSSVPVPSGHA
jgi:lipopolysaccharide transport system ATP-binding protein